MRQAYKFLTKNLTIILIGSVLTTIMGVVALILGYNKDTSWLRLHGACTIIFAIIGFATMCYAGYIAINTKNMHIAKIKKDSGFLRFASILACAMLFFLFALETYKIIIASYQNAFSENFTVWRVLKYIFALPASCYFLFMALPTKYKRKQIKIPKLLQYITSVCAIMWGVFGLLAAYFYKAMTTMNILKIWQILAYLTIIVFLLFDVKFEHLNTGKKTPRALIFMGNMAFIVTMAFNLTVIIGLMSGTIPTSKSFSASELICSFTIGLYAFARVYALSYTARFIINNSDNSSSSSKFSKHHHDNVDANADNSENNEKA